MLLVAASLLTALLAQASTAAQVKVEAVHVAQPSLPVATQAAALSSSTARASSIFGPGRRRRLVQDLCTADPSSVEVTGPGSWGPHDYPPLPIEIGEVTSGILTLDGKPYLIVFGEHDRNGPPDEKGVTFILDFEDKTWTVGSVRPYVGDHHAAEVYENLLYVFGGLKEGEGGLQVAELVSTGDGVDVEWSVIPGPGEAGVVSGSGNTALIGDMVYYCGGVAGEYTTDACASYNITTQTWQEETSMPQGRNHAASCTDGNRMFVFGGRDGPNTVGYGFADTQIFTPAEDDGPGSWEPGAPMPLPRGGMGKAIYYGGKCFVFGGEMNAEQAVELKQTMGPGLKVNALRSVYQVDVYDIATDSWTQATDMPLGLHGMFPVLHCGQVILAGGGEKMAYSQSTKVLVYSIDA